MASPPSPGPTQMRSDPPGRDLAKAVRTRIRAQAALCTGSLHVPPEPVQRRRPLGAVARHSQSIAPSPNRRDHQRRHRTPQSTTGHGTPCGASEGAFGSRDGVKGVGRVRVSNGAQCTLRSIQRSEAAQSSSVAGTRRTTSAPVPSPRCALGCTTSSELEDRGPRPRRRALSISTRPSDAQRIETMSSGRRRSIRPIRPFASE